MATPTKLTIYNGALVVHLGESPLETLTDDVPVRYLLDDVWDRGGVDTCLEQGYWNHAIRTVRLEYEPSITPEFGHQRAFEIPTDHIRTAALCSDEYFKEPFRDYQTSAGYWWCDLDQIYVRYVSNDNQYGGDFSLWPENFSRFAESWFAEQITNSATYADKKKDVAEASMKLLKKAQATDAMEQPSVPMPRGSWSRARGGGRSDYGSRSRLIG
jgi:hypothetical protein